MKNRTTQLLTRAGLLCAVLCVLAIITIPTGAVPFTGALLGLFLCAFLLPPHYAFLAALVYLAIGAIGIPVFSGMKGGIDVLVGLTGGYLWSYPLVALTASALYTVVRKKCNVAWKRILFGVLCVLPALLVCYALGTAWFLYVKGGTVSLLAALSMCVFPFIPFDILKGVLAVLAAEKLPK